MFLIILLPIVLVLGMVFIAGPAILPLAVIGAAALLVYRTVVRHREHDRAAHGH
jgi:hypothetical protein